MVIMMTLERLKEVIEGLSIRQRELQAELEEIKADLKKSMIEAFQLKKGIGKGDKVIVNNKYTAEIVGFNLYHSKVTPVVKLYKKDGTLYKNTKQVYSWDTWQKLDNNE